MSVLLVRRFTLISLGCHFIALNLNIIVVSVCFYRSSHFLQSVYCARCGCDMNIIWLCVNWCWCWCICRGQVNTLHSINRWACYSLYKSQVIRYLSTETGIFSLHTHCIFNHHLKVTLSSQANARTTNTCNLCFVCRIHLFSRRIIIHSLTQL